MDTSVTPDRTDRSMERDYLSSGRDQVKNGFLGEVEDLNKWWEAECREGSKASEKIKAGCSGKKKKSWSKVRNGQCYLMKS